jgi:hypothetical protein
MPYSRNTIRRSGRLLAVPAAVISSGRPPQAVVAHAGQDVAQWQVAMGGVDLVDHPLLPAAPALDPQVPTMETR